MSTRSDYTGDEWEAIRRTPAIAAIAMERASPSGFLGRRRERKAAERALTAIISAYAGIELVDALIAAAEEEGRLMDSLREGDQPLADEAIASAGPARRAIEAKGTREELEVYVNSILGVCEEVGVADREPDGGDLSPAERLLLQRLAAALGRPDYVPGEPDFSPPGRETPTILVGLENTGTEHGLGQQRR